MPDLPNRRQALLTLGAAGLAVAGVGSRSTLAAGPASGPAVVSGDGDRLQRLFATISSRSTVTVPPGRYRVTPHDHEHLVLRDLADVRIIADGVELVCTQTTRALTIERCNRLTLRGLTIDYDPLPFTQGRIVGVADAPDGGRVHEIALADGYPDATTTTPFKYEVYDATTRRLCTDDRDVTHVEALGPRRLRVTVTRPGTPPERVGDRVVIASEHAPDGSIPHAIVCDRSGDVTLEKMTLYASNCFGYFETDCDGSVYRQCRVGRRDVGDPWRRGDPRLRSLNADAFNSSRAHRGPQYDGCVAAYQGDDCVNVSGDYDLISAADGPTLRVLAKRDLNITAGDTVELVGYDGRRLPDARVVAVEPAGDIDDGERLFLAAQRMDAGLKRAADGQLTHGFRVTLDRAAALPRGSVICSAGRVGNGASVTGCGFGPNRSRGVLINASHSVVRGNHFDGNRMAAVLVSPEYWWLEAANADDLTIAGNTIVDCGATAIVVEAQAGDGSAAPPGAHHGIRITGNRITGSPWPAVRVGSTTGGRVTGNVIAPTPGKADHRTDVETTHCEGVVVNPVSQ